MALIGAANLIVLLVQASALIHSQYLNADNASALVLPALAGHLPAGAVVNIGNHPWYEPWWFMRATVGLPGYRQLWEVAPLLGGVLSSAAVAACAWWALGRVAGLCCAVVLFAASEVQRWTLYVPEAHGLILIHLAVLCAALMFVQRRALEGRLTLRALAIVGIPTIVFTGAGLTDQLMALAGLPALLAAPLLSWWRTRTHPSLVLLAFALVTAVASSLLALALAHVMTDAGVVHAPFPINFVGSEAILSGLQHLLVTVTALGGGEFFGAPVSGSNLLTFLVGLLTLFALAAVLRALWRWLTVPAQATAQASAGSAPVEQGHELGRATPQLFVAFWGAALLASGLVFALTSVSTIPSDGRYLIAGWTALAALLGMLAATGPARMALLAGVGVFAVLNLHTELQVGVPSSGVGPNQVLAGDIEHFVRAHGASVGYGSYWDSAPVTWETHLRVRLYPLEACPTPGGVCPFSNNQISSWYTPKPGMRTFLLTDARPNVPDAIATPPASFGKPLASETIGEGLTVYVYGHDVAADLG